MQLKTRKEWRIEAKKLTAMHETIYWFLASIFFKPSKINPVIKPNNIRGNIEFHGKINSASNQPTGEVNTFNKLERPKKNPYRRPLFHPKRAAPKITKTEINWKDEGPMVIYPMLGTSVKTKMIAKNKES